MKKNTIALPDEEIWLIYQERDETALEIVIEQPVNNRLNTFIIYLTDDCKLSIKGKINAPNLEFFYAVGRSTNHMICNMDAYFEFIPSLSYIRLESTGITEIPGFLSECKNLVEVSLKDSSLYEIPPGLFDLQQLESLSIESAKNIHVLPDNIKQLFNLTHFDFRFGDLDYLSAELFRLPKLKHANFAYCLYTPTEETTTALEEWLEQNDNARFTSWQKGSMP